MFLSDSQISKSLRKLEFIHPFYGTTFLACKLARLPVGHPIDIQIAERENELLFKYYNPIPNSDYYYRVFISSAKNQRWVSKKKYATSTLQSTRTQGSFALSFLHETNTSSWGWAYNYITILGANLSNNRGVYKGRTLPVFDLAVWIFRNENWDAGTIPQDLIDKFLLLFNITEEEKDSLLNLSIPDDVEPDFLRRDPVTASQMRNIVGSPPPDAQPDSGGTLAYLELHGVGPAKHLVFEPAQRLSLITGDNGLGKTFLLECAWWALTGQWANPNLPAYPRPDAENKKPRIIFQISGESGTDDKTQINYDWSSPSIDKWPAPDKRPTIPGLLIYARVDGSFAICDPVGRSQALGNRKVAMPRSYVFTREQVWDGFDEIINGQKRSRMNGLVRDWVSWQNQPDQTTFNTFKKVLSRLSPPAKSDLGPLEVGPSVRLPDDSRDIPTIEHSYGRVPVVHASAGVRRIITIAYLLVWAWNEHQINSREAHTSPQKRMVVLIDELEAHLHPHWQRRILPALLEVKDDLAIGSDLQVQSIIATHSPLVMASVEPQFDAEHDKLFHLDIEPSSLLQSEVQVKEFPFVRRGLVDFWLTSNVFELDQARSIEAEEAIEEAKALQEQEEPSAESVQRVSLALQKYLSEIDPFWPRWLYFAKKHGGEL